jgi:Asp-tRNA(Asn)/Glu-tRNA(Gln) amidotransferase A subunit family amidase
MTLNPETATARGIAKAIAREDLHPQQVAEVFQARIAAIEPQIGAFVRLNPAPLASAGPLASVPFGVKDVIDTADLPTGYGSDTYPGWQPCRDAPVVHLARQAGALVLGKTVTTEFATAAPGRTVNPFDPARTPGGSSSGSAAALAAGMVLLAYGTQTSGSTIRPASYCGVVGYKASAGLIDRTGVKPLSGTLDVVGLMARDVRDVALLASVAMRRPEMVTEPALPRIGLFLADQPDCPSDVAMAVADRAAGVLGAVAPVPAPGWWPGLGPAQADVFGWEVSACLGPDRDLHWDRLHPATQGFLTRAGAATFADWQAGLAARDAALADLDRLFGDCDVLMTQPAPGEAPLGLGATGPAAYNIRWTLLGCPALSLPAGLGPQGLPVGVQLVARPGQDRLLLSAAAAIEDRLRHAGLAARPDRIAPAPKGNGS